MTTIAVKINMNNKIAVEIKREDTRISAEQLPAAEILTEAVEESGEDQSGTAAVVTPTKMYSYNILSKFMSAIQETNMGATAEIAC